MGRSVIIFCSTPKSNFLCVFDVFLDLVILVYLNSISVDFYAVKCLICINYVSFHVYKLEKACITDLNASRILMNLFFLHNFDISKTAKIRQKHFVIPAQRKYWKKALSRNFLQHVSLEYIITCNTFFGQRLRVWPDELPKRFRSFWYQ